MNSFLGKMKEKVVSLSMHVCYHVKLNIIYLNRLQQLKCCLLSAINLSAQCNKDFSTINLSAQCNKYFSAINLSAQCNKHFRDQGCSKPIPNQSQYWSQHKSRKCREWRVGPSHVDHQPTQYQCTTTVASWPYQIPIGHCYTQIPEIDTTQAGTGCESLSIIRTSCPFP